MLLFPDYYSVSFFSLFFHWLFDENEKIRSKPFNKCRKLAKIENTDLKIPQGVFRHCDTENFPTKIVIPFPFAISEVLENQYFQKNQRSHYNFLRTCETVVSVRRFYRKKKQNIFKKSPSPRSKCIDSTCVVPGLLIAAFKVE